MKSLYIKKFKEELVPYKEMIGNLDSLSYEQQMSIIGIIETKLYELLQGKHIDATEVAQQHYDEIEKHNQELTNIRKLINERYKKTYNKLINLEL